MTPNEPHELNKEHDWKVEELHNGAFYTFRAVCDCGYRSEYSFDETVASNDGWNHELGTVK